MKTNEIFEHVLQIVCEECELCYGELINGANKNAVDARCLLICALVSLGFSEENTAAYLSMTRQGVNKLKNSLKQRCSGSFILSTTLPRERDCRVRQDIDSFESRICGKAKAGAGDCHPQRADVRNEQKHGRPNGHEQKTDGTARCC